MYTFYLLACQVSHTAGESVRSLWLYLCVMNMEVKMMGYIYISTPSAPTNWLCEGQFCLHWLISVCNYLSLSQHSGLAARSALFALAHHNYLYAFLGLFAHRHTMKGWCYCRGLCHSICKLKALSDARTRAGELTTSDYGICRLCQIFLTGWSLSDFWNWLITRD